MAKANLRKFDYVKIAKLDAEMWRTYYAHRFVKLFWQLLLLFKSQLGLNWITTARIAFHSAWAAADYRLNRNKLNRDRVRKNLTKYYKVISDHATEPFDYTEAGKRELEWFDEHHFSKQNNSQFELALARAAAAMYNTKPKVMSEYAHYRAEAMMRLRNKKVDWEEVDRLLFKSWQSLHSAVQK